MSDTVLIDSTWVRDRFNLQYNNIFSNQAPGLEDFELSMYLNMAHVEIIDEYSNNLDLFEKYRSVLSGYIYDDVIPNVSAPYSGPNDPNISKGSTRGIDYQLFEFSEDYWRILKEYAITNSNQLGIPIKPIKYDEFNTMCQNPYKRPNGLKGWRLDINYDPNTDSKRDVKIFFKKVDDDDYIKEYRVVYLVTPDKFDLESDVIPKTLINNLFLTEKIINRSVEFATRDYRENSLQAQIQTNNRSK